MVSAKPLLIGNSPAIKKIHEIIGKVSNVDMNVLVTGESGVGKELVARSLHYYSSRSDQPFIKVNSAALPSEIVEAELFGYEKGAFTGAEHRKTGKFEQAKHGAIFLDEIGEIPFYLQAKLLQVLHDRVYHRVGGHNEVQVTARVIAATNLDLDKEVSHGNYRLDLYHRLSSISIHIPPLRERREDIPLLVEHFLKSLQDKHRMAFNEPAPALMVLFMQYHWPGNVRELNNYLTWLYILEDQQKVEETILAKMNHHKQAGQDAFIPMHSFFAPPIDFPVVDESLPTLPELREQAVRSLEKHVIGSVLARTNWRRNEAAHILGISYRTLLYKIKELDLHPPSRD